MMEKQRKAHRVNDMATVLVIVDTLEESQASLTDKLDLILEKLGGNARQKAEDAFGEGKW